MTRPAGPGANLRWQPRDAINSGAAPANYMAPPATRMAHTLFLPRMPHIMPHAYHMRMLQTAGPQRPAPAELDHGRELKERWFGTGRSPNRERLYQQDSIVLGTPPHLVGIELR
jgi:hypothetical protein